jgi:predicted naringenin-chalcone synthase
MSFITSLGVAVPPNRFHQAGIASFIEKVMKPDYEHARKLRTIFRSSGIETRHSVLDDYGKDSKYTFYSNEKDFEPFPSTEQRIKQYRQHALPLSIGAIEDCLQGKPEQGLLEITHLITVSCTGMYAPGLDIDLVKSLGLREDVNRTSINFMGCYAAFNALKIADSVCRSDASAKVLIVCTELCTLHFQKEVTEDNLLANALFADGAAAMLVESQPTPGWNLGMETFHNALAYNGQEHMAWSVGNLGFEMRLSTYVPDVIRSGIRKLTNSLLDKVKMSKGDISYFAIHPGGKKILEAIEQELGITKEQNEHAYGVLDRYGNMSSPTVVFVLHSLIQQLQEKDNGKSVLCLAFGPGLTLESMILRTLVQ